ncbi:hypothetical protein A3Q56_07953 [Intoshia linei]|uniref:Uncharacterized protein n=1 Tax=Intoshia linei TaxID=1819745 RepID=A0A177AQQ7_9BILA|nr:hypothetical protein A3Q56_07953 [Intoshia linei]
MNDKRNGFFLCLYNERLCAIGGTNNNGFGENYRNKCVDNFCKKLKKWIYSAFLNERCCNFAATVFKNSNYVIAGYDGRVSFLQLNDFQSKQTLSKDMIAKKEKLMQVENDEWICMQKNNKDWKIKKLSIPCLGNLLVFSHYSDNYFCVYVFGWIMTALTLIPILIVAVYQIIKNKTPTNFYYAALCQATKPEYIIESTNC